MSRIHIGNEWVNVPKTYLAKEREYTDKEITLFRSLPEGIEKEKARQLVLDKRVEFYKKEIQWQ